MHRCTRKQYADKLLGYTVQITVRAYVYVYAYVYVRVHIHTRTCARKITRHKLLTVQDMVYLVLFVAYGGYSCLLGALPRMGT